MPPATRDIGLEPQLAFSTACMCRVSTQTTGKKVSARALNSHCDSGPASQSNSLKVVGRVLQHRQ